MAAPHSHDPVVRARRRATTRARLLALGRRALLGGLVVAFLSFIIRHLAEIEMLLETLARGRWPWILAATALEMAFYVLFAALFRAAFLLIGIRTRLRDMLPITFATLFINSTTPTAGTAGWALFIEDIRRRGGSAAGAAPGTILGGAAYYGVFALTLSIGLVLLLLQRDLTVLELVSAGLMFLLAGSMIGVIALGLFRPSLLRQFFTGVQAVVNKAGRLARRSELLPADWAAQMAVDFAAAGQAVAVHPDRLRRLLATAVALHLANVLCLGALFLAFDQPLRAGTVLAGYAMTFLFVIISPTPNGIGIVETIMPLVYVSLGLSAEAGTVITLAFRGISFWLPLLVGFVLLQRLRMFSGPERALAEAGNVQLAATLTAVLGAINVLAALSPALTAQVETLTQLSPLLVRHGSRVTSALTGFALLVLASGLWRHKRAAWTITLGVLLVSAASHGARGAAVTAILAGLLALYLWSQRRHFLAISDRPSARQGLVVLVAALAFTLAYGTAGFYLLSQYRGVPFVLADAVRQTLTVFQGPTPRPLTDLNSYFVDTIYVVGAGTLAYALVMLLRPVLVRGPASTHDRRRAAAIVARHGRHALARLALLSDKAYFFSPGGSVVAYTVQRRTAVALGDPIGPEDDQPGVIAAFREHCRRHDWNVSYYQASPELLPSYRAAGFSALPVGQEVMVNLSGPPPRAADHASPEIRHLHDLGYQTVVHTPPLPESLLDLLGYIHDDWLSLLGSVGDRLNAEPFDVGYVRDSHAIVLYTVLGYPTAFLTFRPGFPAHGVALDLLRHRRRVRPGSQAMLLGRLQDWARHQGYLVLCLGFRPELPRPAGESLPAVLTQAVADAHEPSRATWQLQGLEDLVRQSQVIDEPRFLVYPAATSLSLVWRTLAQLGPRRRFSPRLWRQILAWARSLARDRQR